MLVINLFVIFAFGVIVTAIVLKGLMLAQEFDETNHKYELYKAYQRAQN